MSNGLSLGEVVRCLIKHLKGGTSYRGLTELLVAMRFVINEDEDSNYSW